MIASDQVPTLRNVRIVRIDDILLFALVIVVIASPPVVQITRIGS
jgi:hypothetical protein